MDNIQIDKDDAELKIDAAPTARPCESAWRAESCLHQRMTKEAAIGKHKETPGRASRAAALYSRHHKTPAYVLKHADGSHTWTAPFSITDGAVALPPGAEIVATFLDGERRD